jgi:hypothetical protein
MINSVPEAVATTTSDKELNNLATSSPTSTSSMTTQLIEPATRVLPPTRMFAQLTPPTSKLGLFTPPTSKLGLFAN